MPTCACEGRRAAGRASLIISTLSLLIAASSVGYAATGGAVLLGTSNKATSTTTIANTNGTPLSLRGRQGAAPLVVGTDVKVKNLNADQLDGVDASGFALRDDLPADLSGYTVMVAGTSCPFGSEVVGLGGRYGAEDEAEAGFGAYLYRVELSSFTDTYVLRRDQAPLPMTACLIS